MTTNGAWVDGVFYDGIQLTAADLNANNQFLLAQAATGVPPAQPANVVFAGPASGGSAVPTFRALVAADIPGGGGGSGTVTSVGLTVPAEFNVAGSPITTAGSLAMSKANQPANSVWAGPTAGVNGPPSFRALVAADIPGGGGGGGTVTSVSLTAPADFVVTGSPVTGSGTLALGYANQSAHAFLAGPASGAATTPAYRPIVAADIPALPYVASVGLATSPEFTVAGSPVTGSGTLSFSSNAQAAHTVWAGPLSGSSAPGFRLLTAADIPSLPYGTGTVMSVGLALPSIFTVSGTPVTGSGVLTGALATQNPGLVFAGPQSGGAAAPTFRSLIASDIPGLAYVSSVGLAAPAEFVVTGSPVTTGSGVLTFSKATQSANTLWAGPTTGAAAAPGFRALVGADLPNPGASTLGGVQSKAPVASNFLTGISVAGVVSAAQPAFTDVSGVAATTQGGTGVSTPTAHGLLVAEGASPMVTIPPGTAGQLVISQGAAVDPAFAAMSGDAVITGAGAITVTKTSGVAFGTFATQNFATPPAIGGTTPNTGAFSTLSASGAVSGAGFTSLFASPPAIGGTAAAAGSFTTLAASGLVSGAGFTALFASPPAIGGTAAAAGTFTTVSATGAGTALAPSVSVGAATIGVYASGGNILGFTNGNVGQTPVNVIANGVLALGSTTALRVGTANTNLAALQILGGNTYAGLNISRWDNSNTNPILSIGKSRSTTVGTPGGAVTSGTNIGAINFVADDGTTMNTLAAQIFVQCNGTVSTGVVPTALVFSTQQGANDFAISAGSLYAGGSIAGKLLLDGTYSYGSPAPSWQRLASTNNFNVTGANGFGGVMFTPAGTLATGTLTMPSAPVDQQEWSVASSQTITALTMNNNTGQTLLGGLTTLAANGFAKWKYFAVTTTWYRVG